MLARTLAVALAFAALAVSARAGTTRYNPQRAGHPLRIIAYIVHPVGVIADTLLFHPAWWLGTHEPLRTLFGVEIVVDDSAEVVRAQAERQVLSPNEAPAPSQPPQSTEPPTPSEPGTESQTP